jgi:hypothetical protein
MKRTLVFGTLVLGACCCLFSSSAIAQTITWQPRPNCKDATPAQRWCEFKRTQLHVGGDNTPYDQWNLIVEAPGPVTDVSCKITGPNQIEYGAAFNGPKRNPFPGDHYGNIGICRCWINGGEAPVVVTVTYQK